MASLNSKVQALIDSVQGFNDQANLLLAAIGQGSFDPAHIHYQIQHATQSAIDGILAQLANYEATSLLERQDMLKRSLDIKNMMGDERYFFEFFKDPFTAADAGLRVDILGTIAGDESVDCSDTSKLTVGETYVISDQDGGIEVVEVSQILTANRFRAVQTLAKTRSNTGTLFRTSWDLSGTGKAVAGNGAYYSHGLDILTADSGGRLLIRRDDGDGTLAVYARQVIDGQPQAWVQCPFVESRMADAPKKVDLYHDIPVGGRVELRVDSAKGPSGAPFGVYYMVAMTPFRAGRADSVRKPVVVAPAAGAVSVSDTPTVTGDAYYSLYGVPQGGMDVEISTDPLFNSVIYQGAEVGAGVAHVVASGQLTTSEAYFVRVRYQDEEGVTSPWSDPVGFATGAVFQYVATPSVVSPSENGQDVALLPTITTSAFVPVGVSDTHAATQYQVAKDTEFAELAYDSGDVSDLVTHTIPVGSILERNTPHYLRVRHKGAGLGYSAWSPVRSFRTVNSANAPTITSPTNGATGVLLPLAITTSAFSFPGGGEAHVATQYQVATDEAFTSLVFNSGDSAHLTALTVPAGTLAALTQYFIRARHKGASTGYSPWSVPVLCTTQAAVGEQIYTAVGSHTFTVPEGVTAVSVVCIGGGASGNGSAAGGGGGGGLRYKNNVAVAPGQQIAVTVGAGGNSSVFSGQSSSFGAYVTATGGAGAANGVGGAGGAGSGGDGGGNGGQGGNGNVAGGGGAAGYAGNGGKGGNGVAGSGNYFAGEAGQGGGAGGGSSGSSGSYTGGGGGGVGILGQGQSGAAGSSGGTCQGGNAGSGGNAGYLGYGAANLGVGGVYGGGGGVGGWGSGAQGAVRIIWGPGRSYPNNAA